MGLNLDDTRKRASAWKAADQNFGLDDLNIIAAQIGRIPNQCVWYFAQEIGGGVGEFVRGYRMTAIDDLDPIDPETQKNFGDRGITF